MGDLEEFIKVTSSGLGVEVGEDDYKALTGVMAHLLAIKDRQPATDDMFEPLKQTIELLQSYDHSMSEEVHQQLEVNYADSLSPTIEGSRISQPKLLPAPPPPPQSPYNGKLVIILL